MDVKGQTWVIVQLLKATRKDALAIFRKGLDHLPKTTSKGSWRDYDLCFRGTLLKRPHVQGTLMFLSEATSEVTLEIRV